MDAAESALCNIGYPGGEAAPATLTLTLTLSFGWPEDA
jgi:hypothetical protein